MALFVLLLDMSLICHALSLIPSVTARSPDFAGRTVCLVDDINTSGATLNEYAKTLKQAGAEKVFAVVAAAQDASG